MTEGIVLFFSSDRDQAHIWCGGGDQGPLCLALRQDFPKQWRALDVGAIVRVETREQGALRRVVSLHVG